VRLGYLACIASLVACAQGIESPGTENLTNATDLGGASSSLGGAGSEALRLSFRNAAAQRAKNLDTSLRYCFAANRASGSTVAVSDQRFWGGPLI